jgi:outer membrane protein assembly factor BamB
MVGFVIASLILPIGFTLLMSEASAGGSNQPDGYWPMERGNPQRNGTSSFNVSVSKPHVLWDIDLTKMAGWNESDRIVGAAFSCVAEDGTIYLANGENVSAIYPDGSLRWTIGMKDRPHMCPAIGGNGDLYIGAYGYDGNPLVQYSAIYSITPNGLIKWRLQLPEIALMLLVDESNTIYASVWGFKNADQNHTELTSNVLVAITPDGSIKWRYSVPVISQHWSICIPAIAPDGTIRFQTEGSLVAINSDGTMEWTFDLPSREAYESNIPLVTDNGTTITICNQSLLSIDSEGRLQWSYDFQMTIDSYSRWLIYANQMVYVCNPGWQNFLVAIRDNGTLAWTIYDNDFSYYGPVMSHNGLILILNDFNQLEAITANGTKVWETEPLYTATSSSGPTEIVIGAEDRIYLRHFNNNDGTPVSLIAVGYEDEHPIISSPPIWLWIGLAIVVIAVAGGFLLWRRSK